MKRLAFIATIITLVSATFAYDWTTNSGDGSDINPYQISTAEQLTSIASDITLLDKCFMLMSDIDLAGAGDKVDGNFSTAVIAPHPAQFTGKFYGNGYSIANMTIIPTTYESYRYGLFGSISGQSSCVKDVRIDNFTFISYQSNYIGALAGYIQDATISNCFATGNIDTSIYLSTQVGGLVGHLSGTLESGEHTCVLRNCGADVTITCNSYGNDNLIGGLVGYIYGGKVTNCISASRLVANSPYYFNTNNCGVLTGHSPQENGEIVDCVTLVDAAYAPMPAPALGITVLDSTEILNQVNFEPINFDFDNVWEMGTNYPLLQPVNIITLESTLTIAEEQQKSIGVYLVNQPVSPVTISVSISDAPGLTVATGSETLTFTSENHLTPQNIYICAADDADYDTNYATLTLTSATDTATIPVTKTESVYDWANNPGSGTIEDPYQIWTIKQLLSVSTDTVLHEKNYKLIADIDLSSILFDKAVIAPDTDLSQDGFQGSFFRGTFDGNGHIIKNLTITTNVRTDYIGLFGNLSSSTTYVAEIKNLGLENVNFNLAQGSKNIGSMIGYMNMSLVRRCYANGNITFASGPLTEVKQWINGQLVTTGHTYENVTESIGGLLGYGAGSNFYGYANYSGPTGLLEDCFADVDISCTVPYNAFYAGGLVAKSIGTPSSMNFKNCYAIGNLSSTYLRSNSFAGFLGDAGSGNFDGTFANCYWDSESTTQTKGVMPDEKYESLSYYPYYQMTPIYYTGITALTTAAMADQANFVGWDFAGETTNGENDYWRMSPQRPMLYFESGINIDKTLVEINENSQQSVEVSLKYNPQATVTVNIAVVDDTDIITHLTTLSFDSTNYATSQTVNISALDDVDFDSTDAYIQFEFNGNLKKLLVKEIDDDNDPDFNKDAWFNMLDFGVLAKSWHTTNQAANIAGDIYIDMEDIVLFAQVWEPTRLYFDDFESGDLTTFDWVLTQDGGSGWSVVDTITDGSPYEGTYCASAYGGNYDHCTMSIQDVDVSDFNTLSFAVKTSTEGGFDFLRFYVTKQGQTEVEVAQWSGETEWTGYEYELEPGIYTFRWAFTKDYLDSYGQDLVWVDKIEFLRLYK